MPKRAVLAWCFFDWAKSAFPTVVQTFLFSAYFTSHVAADPASGTAAWGQATGIAALAIALLSPPLGAVADVGGRRKPWLAALTLLTVLATAALWFVRPDPAFALLGLVAMALGTVGFELGTVFYNAMLPGLVAPARIGRISGWAWAMPAGWSASPWRCWVSCCRPSRSSGSTRPAPSMCAPPCC
jgi:UMF1 family MFS transporter